MSPRGRILLCALAVLGCAQPPVAPSGAIRVDFHGSSARRAGSAAQAALLVDVTPAPAEERISLASRRDHDAHACRSALEWSTALPAGVMLELQPFQRDAVAAPGSACSAGAARAAASGETWRVADAAAALARFAERESLPQRIALFADLGGDPARLCASARAIAARGGWLDVFALGAASPPDCLDAPSVPSSAPAALAPPPSAPRFRVVRSAADTAELLLARGWTGAPAVAVPPGPASVVLEVDGDERIGPFLVSAGGLTTIRVFELTASSGESAYGWSIETEATDAR